MSKKMSIKTALFALGMAVFSMFSAYADEPTCDLRAWNLYPSSSADVVSKDCPIKLVVRNEGNQVEYFYAKISLNDQELFTERVNHQVDNYSMHQVNDTVTLAHKLNLAYGEAVKIDCELLPPDGVTDTDTDNNTFTKSFIMPTLVAFPYEWNPDDCLDRFPKGSNSLSTWGFFNMEMTSFYLQSGKGTNWRGALMSNVFDVPDNQDVKFSFDYKVEGSVPVRMTVMAITDVGIDTLFLGEVSPESIYNTMSFYFKSKGVTRLSIQASLTNVLQYGTLYINAINFVKDEPDIAVNSITGPALSSIAVGTPVNVSAQFVNKSGFDIENPIFKYKFGAVEETETYITTLKAGEKIDYVFQTPLLVSEASSGTLTVSCEADVDMNSTNNSVEKQLSFYAPLTFPYYTDFESDRELWSMIDGDGDGETWKPAQYLLGEEPATMLTHISTTHTADYAFSPAIKIPAGKSRISFYVAGINGRGNSHLNVLMGKSPDIASMTKITEYDVNLRGWYMVYALIDVPEEDIYYFAIEATEAGDQIGVDFFRIDRENDLCIETVVFDTGNGFNKTTSNVTLSLFNYGIDPQNGIDVRYYLNSLDKYVDGRITDTIEPGERYSYTFTTPADISVPGEYTLIGEIVTKVGPDSRNDMIFGQTVCNYPVLTVPYVCDFENTNRSLQWSFKSGSSNNSWLVGIANMNAYDGSWVLAHESKNTEVGQIADDWAFSECIEIPAGKYDLSFLYRTMKNWSTEPYYQNFKVMIGSDATPEAMAILAAEFKNLTVPGASYKRHLSTIEIPADGRYYIGFHNSSPRGNGGGYTYIDHITLEKNAQAGISLPYKADFANALNEWELTNPNNRNWSYKESEGAMVLDRSAYYGNMEGSEGQLTSPKLHLPAGELVTVTLEYTATMVKEEAGDMRMTLYSADTNLPEEYKAMATFGRTADYATVTHKFYVGNQDRDCYFGIRTNLNAINSNYKLTVKNFEVASNGTTGIDAVESESTLLLSRNGNIVTVSASEEVLGITVYDPAGHLVAHVAGEMSIELPERGMYIVAIDFASSREVRKIAY